MSVDLPIGAQPQEPREERARRADHRAAQQGRVRQAVNLKGIARHGGCRLDVLADYDGYGRLAPRRTASATVSTAPAARDAIAP